MKPLKLRSITSIFFSTLTFLLASSSARAHDPFDCSSRMTVSDYQIEILVTVGLDGARQILSQSGLSSAQVAETVRTRGPHSALDLPVKLAADFFEIKNGDEKFTAKSVTEFSEGMEVIFTLIYPRPTTGTLNIRANYYDHIPDLHHGSFVAYDEEANQLSAVLLSRASVFARVFLPELKTGGESPVSTSPAAVKVSASAPSIVRPSSGEFFKLGVEHILTGFDHLLFLAALLIGVRKPAAMLGIITCFTLAHSLTLALASLNVVTISSRITEPLIALSIIVVCIENLIRKEAGSDRLWLAGGFGLIHGFGFASALRETGLGHSAASVALPLLSFNIGVEAGQLAVAAILLPALFLLRRWPGFVRYGMPATSAAVIVISGYWLVERVIISK